VTELAMTPYQARVDTLGRLIAAKSRVIDDLLPRHASARRFRMIMYQECQRNPRLMECLDTHGGQMSLIGAMLEAFRLGLEPGGSTGACYLIPVREQGGLRANLWMGYRGLIQLAWNSGLVHGVQPGVVYEVDDFAYQFGTDAYLRHRPAPESPLGDDKILCVYALAKHAGGNYDFVVLPKSQVDAVRAKSPGRDSEGWVHHYPEMAKKTAIKRLLKTQPLTAELAAAIGYDDMAEIGKNQQMDAIVPVEIVDHDPTGKQIRFLRSLRSQATTEHGLSLEDLDSIFGEETGGDAWPRPTSGEDEAETAAFSKLPRETLSALIDRLRTICGTQEA